MTVKLTWEHGWVFWKYSGNVSGQEILGSTSVIYGDPRFDDLKYKLVDFIDVENIEMSDEDVTMIACRHRVAAKSNPRIKNAILVKPGTNELAYKFVSFFDDSPWFVKVFHDMEKANNWIGRESSS